MTLSKDPTRRGALAPRQSPARDLSPAQVRRAGGESPATEAAARGAAPPSASPLPLTRGHAPSALVTSSLAPMGSQPGHGDAAFGSDDATLRHRLGYLTKASGWSKEGAKLCRRPPVDDGPDYHREDSLLMDDLRDALTTRIGAPPSQGPTRFIPVAHPGYARSFSLSYRVERPQDLNSAVKAVRRVRPDEAAAVDLDSLVDVGVSGQPLAPDERALKIQSLIRLLRPSATTAGPVLFGTVDVGSQKVVILDDPSEIAHGWAGRRGLMPSRTRARATIVELLGPSGALAASGPDVTLPFPRPGIDGAASFFRSEPWQAYRAAFDRSSSTPTTGIELIGAADLRLIDALPTESGLPPGRARAVGMAYARLATLLDQSLQAQDSSRTDFMLVHERIHEELLYILDETRPYDTRAFEDSVRRHLGPGPSGLEPPRIFAFESGMACFDALLNASAAIHGGELPRVAFASGLYYETEHILERELRPFPSGRPRAVPIESPAFARDAAGGAPLFVADIHRSAGTPGAPGIRPVEADIRKILEHNARHSVPKTTVVLDVTLDKVDSKEVRRIVANLGDAIASGRADLVLYRSAQKFDQLGVDRINAGYMEVYSSDGDGALARSLAALDGQLQGPDYQLLTHLHLHARASIHAYPKQHIRNARRIWDELAPSLSRRDAVWRLPETSDRKVSYVELVAQPAITSAQRWDVVSHLAQATARLGTPVTLRNSFGFNEPVISFTTPRCLRLSAGTEPPEQAAALGRVLRSFELDLALASRFQELWPVDFSQYLLGRTSGFCAPGPDHPLIIDAFRMPVASALGRLDGMREAGVFEPSARAAVDAALSRAPAWGPPRSIAFGASALRYFVAAREANAIDPGELQNYALRCVRSVGHALTRSGPAERDHSVLALAMGLDRGKPLHAFAEGIARTVGGASGSTPESFMPWLSAYDALSFLELRLSQNPATVGYSGLETVQFLRGALLPAWVAAARALPPPAAPPRASDDADSQGGQLERRAPDTSSSPASTRTFAALAPTESAVASAHEPPQRGTGRHP